MPNALQEERPRLEIGSRIGRCTVAAFLGREALGERYAVYYGTTKHVLDLVVPPDAPGAPTLEDYRDYIRRLTPVARNSGFVHALVCGADPYIPPVRHIAATDFDYGDSPDSGEDHALTPAPDAPRIPWMRTEHVSGVPLWAFRTDLDPAVVQEAMQPLGSPDDDAPASTEEELGVPDLALFLAASRGKADPGELAGFLDDLIGAIAALHRLKIPADAPLIRDIAIDRTSRRSGAIARLSRYGESKWDWMSAARDLDAFSVILRECLKSIQEKSPLAAVLGDLAAKIDAGAFPTAVEAAAEFSKRVGAAGIELESAARAAAAAAAAARRQRSPAELEREVRRQKRQMRNGEMSDSPSRAPERHSHRHGNSSFSFLSSDSEAVHRIRTFIGAALFLVAICAIGFGVWFYMTWSDERGRERYAQTYMADAPVVTVIPVETAADSGDSGAMAAFRLSGPALATAAAAGEPFAKARAAVEALLDSAPNGPTASALAETDSAMAAILPELLDSPADDAAASFMRGVGALLALGRPSEPSVAWRELEIAATAGFPRAAVLFGDLVCGAESRVAPAAAPQGAVPADPAERDRLAAKYYRSAADSLGVSPALRAGAIDRVVCLLRRAPNQPPAAFVDEFRPFVRAAATEGHISAMALMSRGGNFGATNAVEALDWLRRINRSNLATSAVKGWAQVRMAARFERGAGTPPSESAARVWYERAALLGNGTAMLRWADYLESGKGDANGLGNPHAAAEWRVKAEDAAPEPDFQPAWWPLSRPAPRNETKGN